LPSSSITTNLRRHGQGWYGEPLERHDVDALFRDPERAVQIDLG
jgi:hypothetical protein